MSESTAPLIIANQDNNPDQYFIKQRVVSSKEFIPIDVEMALFKEKLLLQHYFGNPDCAANDFIDGKLDAILSVQLLAEDATLASCQKLVRQYISNYVNWASIAKLHSIKIQNKESVLSA